MSDVRAVILCAGLGTRLRPLTETTPKPAVPLFGRPLVGYSMALAKAAGFERVVINTHWRPEAMASAADEAARGLGLGLTVSYEPAILGTGGVFRKLRDDGLVPRDAAILVLNGDVLFDVDLREVLKVHAATGAAATMVLRAMPEGASYSPVEADATGRIRRIGRYGEAGHGKARLFTGVHVLSPEALDLLPEGGSGIVEAVYARLLASGARVQATAGEGLWLDLGDPKGYLDAHLELMRCGLGTLPLPAQAIEPGARIDPTAKLIHSAVGHGAVVEGGAEVIDSVVWPGAVVRAGEKVERTIVTPEVRVGVD